MTPFAKRVFDAFSEEEKTALILMHGTEEKWAAAYKRELAYGEVAAMIDTTPGLRDSLASIVKQILQSEKNTLKVLTRTTEETPCQQIPEPTEQTSETGKPSPS